MSRTNEQEEDEWGIIGQKPNRRIGEEKNQLIRSRTKQKKKPKTSTGIILKVLLHLKMVMKYSLEGKKIEIYKNSEFASFFNFYYRL